MSGALRRITGGSFVAAPGRRLSALRILVAGYATVWTTVRAPHLLDTIELEARRLDPIGPLAWIDGPLPAVLVVAAVVVTPLFGIAATVGWRYRVSAPALAVGFLFLTTYRNSWGQIFHTENLTAVHLLVLAVAPADGHWSLRRDRGTADDRLDDEGSSWAVEAMAVMTVCAYFVAGIAKLRNAGWAWVDGDVILHQVSYDNARKDLLGDTSSPLAGFFTRQSWMAAPAAVGSMVIELGAPLALLGRYPARLWSAAAWSFHVAILALMAILFPYQLLGIALAPLLPVERLVGRAAAIRPLSRLRSPRAEAVPSSQ